MIRTSNLEKAKRIERGSRLKKLRKICNLSQAEVALMIQPSEGKEKAQKSGKAFISRVESGSLALPRDSAESIIEGIEIRINHNEKNIREHIANALNIHNISGSIIRATEDKDIPPIIVEDYSKLYPDLEYLTGESPYYNKSYALDQQKELTKRFSEMLLPIISLLGYQLIMPENFSKDEKDENNTILSEDLIGENCFPLYKITEKSIAYDPSLNNRENAYAGEDSFKAFERNAKQLGIKYPKHFRLRNKDGKEVILYYKDIHDILLNIYQDIDIILTRALQRGTRSDNEVE